MNDIEAKALALWNEVRAEREYVYEHNAINRNNDMAEALCRAIERHEAFKQEVSDAVVGYYGGGYVSPNSRFANFIIPKPKPDLLEQALKNMDGVMERLEAFRAELVTLELEIREKGQ
jgi:hypothetical protein